MGMAPSQLDYLDEQAVRVRAGDDSDVGVLSTGEYLYVALAGNSMEMLKNRGYTIAQALDRVGSSDIGDLIERWRYK